MKVGGIAASVAALATMGFASSALAASAQSEHRVVGPAGYSQGPNTLVIAGGVPVPTVGPGDHVVICHALGQANKDTYVQIAPSAGVVFGHAGDGHQLGEDIIPPFIYQPNGNGDTDRSLAAGQNWDPAHIAIYQNGCAALPPVVVTDVCLNIGGTQETVPAGMGRDANGNCAAHPVVVVTDLCLNIAGNQESVPAGMVRNANGNCAAPPVVVVTDLCLNIGGNQETVPAGMTRNGEGACLTPSLVITSTVTAATPASTPAPAVVAPVVAKPTSAVLGVSTKVVTKAKAKTKKAIAKKAKVKKAVAKKAKAKKAKAVKAKVTRIRALPFTP